MHWVYNTGNNYKESLMFLWYFDIIFRLKWETRSRNLNTARWHIGINIHVKMQNKDEYQENRYSSLLAFEPMFKDGAERF